jgi:hypothetical protein
MSLKRILACPIICSIVCLMFAELPLIFICPILEYQKLKLFDSYDISYNVYIEYSYLALTVFQLLLAFLVLCCCCFCAREDLSKEFSLATILWLIIPIIYTVYTVDELGDIPGYCPANYDYKDPQLRHVCQIRIANLACMWIMFLGILSTGVLMCVPKEVLIDVFNDDDDEEYSIFDGRDNRSNYQSIKQDDANNGKIQIIKYDEPNDSSSVDANRERSERDPNKPKGREETFGFNNGELHKFTNQPDDSDKLKHVV